MQIMRITLPKIPLTTIRIIEPLERIVTDSNDLKLYKKRKINTFLPKDSFIMYKFTKKLKEIINATYTKPLIDFYI